MNTDRTSQNGLARPSFSWIRSTLTVTLLARALALQATPPPTGIAPVTVPAGGFSIDGNLTADGVSGDWLPGSGGIGGVLDVNGVPLNPATTFHFTDKYNSSADNTFTSGAKWDDDPNTWTWTKGSASSKNDMNNVLLHVTTDTNLHTWLIVAADRLSTSGDSYIDFEFLQNNLIVTNKGRFISTGPDGGRTVNDLVLSVDFNVGGSVSDFLAWRWLPNGSGGFEYVDSTSALTPGGVYLAANTTNVPVAFGAFGQTTYAPNAFIEAAIDLTALMRDFDPCLSLGIKTIMIKTKTSPSLSSSVVDFIDPIQFALRLGPQANAGPNQTQCSQGSSTAFSLQGQATPGDLPLTATTWSVISGNATIDSPGSLNTTAHVSSSNARLRLTVLQANGCVKTSDVVLTVASTPTCSISGPASTCPGSTVQFVAPAGMDSYSWSISGNGTISGTANGGLVTVNAGAVCGSGFDLTLNVTSNGCPATCNSSVMVMDTVPPTITAPPDVALECPADTTPASTGVASAQDNCGQVSVSFSDAVTPGCGGTKSIVRTWTATDGCGNSASAVQNISVRDTTPPLISAPPSLALECPADTSPSNTGSATAQDGCSSVVITFNDVVANPCGGAKVITRNWIATDACGNSANAVQTITVRDTTPPTITAPSDVTLECPADTNPSNTGTATAQDGCSSVVVAFNDVVANNCGGTKVITRTWSATDACGNSANALQTITVRDTTPPTVTAPPDVTLECPADTTPNGTGTATAQDGCSAVTVTYDDVTDAGCGGAKVINRTWTATDACGNSATAVQKITLRDTTAPTVTVPADVVVPFTSDISPNTTGQAAAQDACSSVNVSYGDALNILADGSQILTRTWTATDACGNSAGAVQTITLQAPGALILPGQTDVVLTNLTTLTVINTATNPNVPANPITYQLIDPPAGASIDGNGVITWTPTLSQSPSTNLITTVVTTTVDSAAGTSTISSTNTFVVIISTPYDGLDLSVDTDGDGLTNLVEYAVGSNPNNPADATSRIIIWITQDNGNHYLAMKFARRTNAAALGLQYLPEVTADKINWASDESNVLSLSVEPLDSDFDWVTVRDQTPITPSLARFIRLHIISTSLESFSPTWIGSDTLIQGTTVAGASATFFSQRMVLPVLYAGTVSGLQNTALSDTNASWTSSQFGNGGIPAYAEFDNGSMVDITSSAAGKSLSMAENLNGVASVGDAYRIRGHFTIASLFGTNNETGLQSGGNTAQADNIMVMMPQTQQTITIFYYDDGVNHGWLTADYTPADTLVIYPEQGLLVRRVAAGNRDLYLCGPIKTDATVAPIQPGYNLVGTLKSLSPMSLGALNLYSGDPATGLASGGNTADSDTLLVVQPDGTTATYFYYKDNLGNEGWLDANYNISADVLIKAGSAFFVHRLPGNGAFSWLIPAE